MNYDNKGTLYEEAKKSIKKSKGVIAAAVLPLSLSQPLSLTMKRPSLLQGMTGGEENRVEAIAGSVGDQGEGDQVVHNFQVLDIEGKEQEEDTNRQNQDLRSANQVTQIGKNINPLGPDGRTLICKFCRSYRHLLPTCPDSWENMRKVNAVEGEHAVLFTGYNIERFVAYVMMHAIAQS